MSNHYQKILKRVVNRLWDTLPHRERDIIAADVNRGTELAKWFHATVKAEAKSKFESPTYWMNDKYSFTYPQVDEGVPEVYWEENYRKAA